MKIIKLTVNGFMGITAAEITPDGNVVLITGANHQGKTSVLNAIWAALGGGDASRAIAQQIKKGEKFAEVVLDLGEYIVKKRWDKNGAGELEVSSPRGAVYGKPQSILDGLISKVAMDPHAFARMEGKKQIEALVGLLGNSLGFDPAELEERRKDAVEARRIANADVRTLSATIESMPAVTADTPTTLLSATDILAEYQAGQSHNLDLEDLERTITEAADEAERARAAMKSLQQTLDSATARWKEAKSDRKAVGDPIDLSPISARIASVDETNEIVRVRKSLESVVSNHVDAVAVAKRWDDELEAIKQEKADGIANANLPHAALSFDDSGVLYNGIPLAQASGKERLMAGFAIALATKPELRVVRVDEGESLDTAAFAELAALADEYDCQVWVTAVREGDSNSIVIHDGHVVTE